MAKCSIVKFVSDFIFLGSKHLKKILFIILFILVMCFGILGWPWHDVPVTNAVTNTEVGADTLGGDNVSTVPEPISLALFGSGLVGLAVLGRKSFRK